MQWSEYLWECEFWRRKNIKHARPQVQRPDLIYRSSFVNPAWNPWIQISLEEFALPPCSWGDDVSGKHTLHCMTNKICLFWSTQPRSNVMKHPGPDLLRFKECDTCYYTNSHKPHTEFQRNLCLRRSTAHSVFPCQMLLVNNGDLKIPNLWYGLKNNLSFRRSIWVIVLCVIYLRLFILEEINFSLLFQSSAKETLQLIFLLFLKILYLMKNEILV